MNFGDYLLGCAGVAAIAISLALAALALRKRLLPAWEGAPARLAEAVLAIGLLTLLLEVLGTAGLLTGPAIVIVSAIVGTAGWVTRLRAGSGDAGTGPGGHGVDQSGRGTTEPREPGPASPDPARPELFSSKLAMGIALAVTALLFAQWAVPTQLSLDRGIYGGDSLWYHLPFAAGFAESGSITALHFTDPLYLNWFYPQNSELIHAAGITLFGNDFLSSSINLGWLGLALLAGWCIGRPYGAAAISLTAVAILLSADLMFSRQPGNANNDVGGLALVLAACALLVNGGLRTRGALIVAGLAAGLALGTKLVFVVPVAALTLGVVAFAGRGARASAAFAWSIPLALGGGYWYVRNAIVAGNPLPWQKLGIGPVALPRSEELEGRDPFSIAHYATDSSVFRHYFFPGFNERFGELWPLLLALAALGVVLALWRGDRIQKLLAGVAVITAIAYVFTPLSASGTDGAPLGFRLNLRYLAPALAIGLTLLAAPSARLGGRERASAGTVLGLLLAVLLVGHSPLAALDDGYLAGALIVGLAAAAVVAIAAVAERGASRAALAAAGCALAALLVGVGWPEQRDYTEQRYAIDAPSYPREEHPGSELERGLGAAYQWARGQSGEEIGIGGTIGGFFQYGFYGPDSSNRVRYIGDRGDRGSFDEIADCSEWREAIAAGGYRFVVTTPGYDQDRPERPLPAPFKEWTASDPGAIPVVDEELVTVFQIDGELDPETCP